MGPVRLLAVLAVLCAVAGPARADGPPPMAGAGSLERDGRTDCSAVLIAPDLVATAAHCVSGTRLPPDGKSRILFRTGAYPGRPTLSRAAVAILSHPLAAAGAVGGLGADIAVLRLEAAVPAEAARPIPPGDNVAEGERVLLATWPGGEGARARERTCVSLGTRGLVATLSCLVVPGESGGGVVRLTPGGPELAGIVVARAQAGRQPLALAVQARDRLRQIGAIHGFETP